MTALTSIQHSSLNSLQEFSSGISAAIPSSHAVPNWSLPAIFPGINSGISRCWSEFLIGFLKKFRLWFHPGVFTGLHRERLPGCSGVFFFSEALTLVPRYLLLDLFFLEFLQELFTGFLAKILKWILPETVTLKRVFRESFPAVFLGFLPIFTRNFVG